MKIEIVWLRTWPGSQTAHAFDDYIESEYGPFLSKTSFCGEARDPAMRIVADLHKHRICLRCSRIHNKRIQRDAERAANLEKYAEPNNSGPP